MTIYATRVDSTPYLRVSMTYGNIVVSVEEPYQYLRDFHTQLGQLLDEMENDRKERAYG